MARSQRVGDCPHAHTTYNEQDDTLACVTCGSWVLPGDQAEARRVIKGKR